MNFTEEQINKIVFVIKATEETYQKRSDFQKKFFRSFSMDINIYSFFSYGELLEYCDKGIASYTTQHIKNNEPLFIEYYENVRKEIQNNRIILSKLKNHIIFSIQNNFKTKQILSSTEIKNKDFPFLPHFYIELFLDTFCNLGYFEKIKLGTGKQQILYKIINQDFFHKINHDSIEISDSFVKNYININSLDRKNLYTNTGNNIKLKKAISSPLTEPISSQQVGMMKTKKHNVNVKEKPNDRINRIKYVSYSFLMSLGLVASSFLLPIVTPIIFIGLMLVASSRFHDLNKSGLNVFWLLVPIVNIFVHFYLMVASGDAGENDYGNPPEPAGTFDMIFSCFHILFYPFIVVAMIEAINN